MTDIYKLDPNVRYNVKNPYPPHTREYEHFEFQRTRYFSTTYTNDYYPELYNKYAPRIMYLFSLLKSYNYNHVPDEDVAYKNNIHSRATIFEIDRLLTQFNEEKMRIVRKDTHLNKKNVAPRLDHRLDRKWHEYYYDANYDFRYNKEGNLVCQDGLTYDGYTRDGYVLLEHEVPKFKPGHDFKIKPEFSNDFDRIIFEKDEEIRKLKKQLNSNFFSKIKQKIFG